jgi:cytochrome c oxidase subunit 2
MVGKTGEAAVAVDPLAKAGAKLFISQTCATCHQAGSSQLGPSLNGLYGTTVLLADGTRTQANESYLRESILQPQAKLVKGYPAAMPSFAHLKPEQVDELVAYIKSLR